MTNSVSCIKRLELATQIKDRKLITPKFDCDDVFLAQKRSVEEEHV